MKKMEPRKRWGNLLEEKHISQEKVTKKRDILKLLTLFKAILQDWKKIEKLVERKCSFITKIRNKNEIGWVEEEGEVVVDIVINEMGARK